MGIVDALLPLVIAAALGATFSRVHYAWERRHPCHCRRSHRYYFEPRHPRGWLMGADIGIWALTVGVATVVVPSVVGAILGAVIEVWLVRRWWFHEKDRIIRQAGRVIFDQHGRLRIAHQEGAS